MEKESLKNDLGKMSKEQLEELKWLILHPDFKERPVDITTFVNHPKYLNLEFKVNGSKGSGCRPRVLSQLQRVFDPTEQYEEFVFCCGIGWGKDFASSIVLCYRLYLLGCLKDPQSYFGLSTGTNIHLMLMSINETHAKDVLFGEVRARIDNSPWFKARFKYNPKINSYFQFPSNIMLIPGNSKDTSFVGYNIFTAIIDEGDDYTSTSTRDDAEEGYNAIKDRITSRFRNKGLLGVIGSPKTEEGFMMRKYKNKENVAKRYCALVPTWDSLLDTPMLCGKTFFYRDLEVPVEYEQRFKSDPERAMRDLGARPAKAKEPFITLTEKIYSMFAGDPPYEFKDDGISLGKITQGALRPLPDTVYYGHIDLALNKDNGDRLGFAFGHVSGFEQIENQLKAKIKIDFACAMTAPAGREIDFSLVKSMLWMFQGFGFDFDLITLDSWNSADMIQSIKSKGIKSKILSVDRTIDPYAALKEALYEDRITCHELNILKSELERLELVGGEKVDHPAKGSKDVADAVAGVVFNIMKSNTSVVMSFTPDFSGERIF